MTETRRVTLPPAWARDPFGRFPHRLFDGRAWTDRVARGGRTFHDGFLLGSPTPAPELSTACAECGFEVGAAKFCPRCGTAAAPLARPPYCYQCGSSPPPTAAFCQDCGSRLDALAPGLTVRDAAEWQVVFGALGWLGESPDPDRASAESLKKVSRKNLAAQLREWDLPAYPGEDPAEPWVVWLSTADRRSAWLSPDAVEVHDRTGDEGIVDAETLIVTRCRVVVIAKTGGLRGGKASLLLHESLANVSEAVSTPGTLRLVFGGSGNELNISWQAASRPPQLAPATARIVANLNNDGSGAPSPAIRRSTDARGGRFLAESVLAAFARRINAISATQ